MHHPCCDIIIMKIYCGTVHTELGLPKMIFFGRPDEELQNINC